MGPPAVLLVPPAGPAAAAADAGGRGGGPPATLGPTEAELNEYFAKMAPKVKGAIVLVGESRVAPFVETESPKRRDDEAARRQYNPDPNAPPAPGRGGRGNPPAGGRGAQAAADPSQPVRLTGAQLLDVIEHGLALDRPSTFSGLMLRYDSSRPRGERVVEVRLSNGVPIDPGKEYLLAMTDFLAQGGDGYTMLAKGKDLTITNTLLRDALVEDARRRGAAKQPLIVPPPGRLVDVSAARRASNASTRSAG